MKREPLQGFEHSDMLRQSGRTSVAPAWRADYRRAGPHREGQRGGYCREPAGSAGGFHQGPEAVGFFGWLCFVGRTDRISWCILLEV